MCGYYQPLPGSAAARPIEPAINILSGTIKRPAGYRCMCYAAPRRASAVPSPKRTALVTTWCPGAGGELFAEATPPAYGVPAPRDQQIGRHDQAGRHAQVHLPWMHDLTTDGKRRSPAPPTEPTIGSFAAIWVAATIGVIVVMRLMLIM